MTSEIYQNNQWLDPENPECKADEYFRQISYIIDLEGIYKVLDSCYYNDDMKYCPILLEIGEEKIKALNNDCQYLIQVWHVNGQKVYEMPLRIKYLTYNNSILYCSNGSDIKITQIQSSKFSITGTEIDIQESSMKIRTYKPSMKIHGFIENVQSMTENYIIVVLETSDNQLDFNMFFITNFDNDETHTCRFQQSRHLLPRVLPNKDPIVKNRFVQSNNFNYSISLRESGCVDLYWNMTRKETITKNVELSLSSFFFKDSKGFYYGFNHQNKNTISFQQAELIPETEIDFQKIHLKSIQNIVKLFTGMKLVKLNKTTQVIITHGRYVSSYEIIQQRWLYHVEFEDDILALFRHIKTQDTISQYILCKNGAFYLVSSNIDNNTVRVPSTKRITKVDGEILRFSEDIEKNRSFFVTYKQNGKIKLAQLYQGSLINLEITNPQDNLGAVCIQIRGKDAIFLIQNGKSLTLYQQKEHNEHIRLKEFSFEEITGNLHSGCSYDLDKNFFVCDQRNMYVVQTENGQKSITTYKDIYCIGLQNFTKNFNYALCQETANSQYGGLRLFDMESIVKKKKIDMLLLKKIDIGSLGYFEFGSLLSRIGFLSSLTQILVTPILHQNMNKFIGIGSLNDYICYNVIGQKFIALHKSGELSTWNVLTGKFERHVQIENLDLNKYELVQTKYKRGAVLLRSKEILLDQNIEDYFFPWELKTEMENQISFVKSYSFEFKKFRQIEIVSSDRVKIHVEYIQPSYQKEWIFINNNHDRMITVLINFRTYFYRAVKLTSEDPDIDYKIKWELIRCIPDYPADLEDDSSLLNFFSPCQSRYMNVDKKTHEITIKETESGMEITRVPKDILKIPKDMTKISQITHKFLWLNANTLQVVSNEGFEKIVDIDDNFKELSYNYRPLFNSLRGVEWEKNYYYIRRSDLSSQFTNERLMRNYQEYKTNYYLHKKKGKQNSMEILFKVDPWRWDYNESSFSYSHWSLIEQLQQGKISIKDLEFSVIESIVYDILPGGNTIFHMIHNRNEELANLLDICHPNKKIKIHIPFLPNFKGQNVISLCQSRQDYKTVDLILQYLSLYPIGHHSRAIKNQIPTFIDGKLPSFLSIYLDSRFQQTQQLKKINKGTLLKHPQEIIVSDLWFKNIDIKSKILDKDQGIETSFILEFLDLPGIYHYLDPAFKPIFVELSETDKFDYFNNRAIQKLIEFNYTIVQKFIIYVIVIPFTIFHISYVIYMNVIYEHRFETDNLSNSNWFFSILLLILAIYFIILEVMQFQKVGIRYFSSIWNFIDIISSLGVIIQQVLQFMTLNEVEVNVNFDRCIMAITTFFMWMKFLQILRIFKKTGYLIRMIIEVVYDMGIFLLIFFLTVVAFGETFLRLSYGNSDDEQFIQNGQFLLGSFYAYRMVIGDFDTSSFGQVGVPLVWIFFLLCTVFDMIVMLNLLIAIISDTYSKMTQNADQAAYQEMAALICENSYIIPHVIKQNYAKRNKFLVCLTKMDNIVKESSDNPVFKKIKHLKNEIEDIKSVLEENQKIQKSMIEEHSKSKKEMMDLLILLKERTQTVFDRFWSKIHAHPLQKMKVHQLRMNPKYEHGCFCDGKKLNPCKKAMTEKSETRKNNDDTLYQCSQPECEFYLCEACFDQYKNAHYHELKKVKFTDLLPQIQQQGWKCNGQKFKPCSHGQNFTFIEDQDIVYHCDKCSWNFCEECFQIYKH